MGDLRVIESEDDKRKKEVAKRLREYADRAEAGEFDEVYILAEYAPGHGDDKGYSFCRSGGISFLQSIGFLETVKSTLIREAVTD